MIFTGIGLSCDHEIVISLYGQRHPLYRKPNPPGGLLADHDVVLARRATTGPEISVGSQMSRNYGTAAGFPTASERGGPPKFASDTPAGLVSAGSTGRRHRLKDR